ncbi:MAG: glycine zipper 2TM domain-containing protein [Gammaproteobacteria bacterium]
MNNRKGILSTGTGTAAALALIGGALLSAGPALADHDRDWRNGPDRGAGYDYARVVDVDPIVRYVQVRTPVRECWEEARYYETAYDDHRGRRSHRNSRDYGGGRDDRGTAGATIAGGIIGGVIGRQFGGGSGRDAMTVVGTLVGAAIGNDRARRAETYDRYEHYDDYRAYERHSRPVTRCETRYQSREEERIDGYRVTYRYRGQTYTTRTDHDPGDRLRVRVAVTPVR